MKLKEEHIKLLNDPDFEKRLLREIYLESYYEFFKDAYKALKPNEPFSDNWHIEFLCNKLQEVQERITKRETREKDLIINIPFRSAKSLITTIVWPVWCWIKDPSLSFITTSFSSALALEHAQESKNLIQTMWFQDLYKNRLEFAEGENKKEFYKIKAGGYRKATGVGGQVTGSGASIIICLPQGQMIDTEIGQRDIKEIVEKQFNILVWSYNHEIKKKELKPIKGYDKNKGKKLIKITTESGKELICTEEHEVWTENRGYIQANQLSVTDIVLIDE